MNNKGIRKYKLDESFFDTIDTEEKAYFLGFLYADGCNFIKRGRASIGLQERDKEILEKFKLLVKTDRPLQLRITDKSRKGFENCQNQYTLILHSRHLSNALVKLGCVNAKTLVLKFPTEDQVPLYLQRHFIRGYFDGDGCVEKNGASFMGTWNFCQSVSKIVKEQFNINFYIRLRSKYPTSEAYIKQKMARTFLKWLYQDSTIYLQRKYEKYLIQMEYEKTLKTKKFKFFDCSVEGCDAKHRSSGYCQYHYDQVRKNNKIYSLKINKTYLNCPNI